MRNQRVSAKHGIPEYWIVSPEESSIAVLLLEGAAYVDCEPVSGDQLIPTRALPGLPVKVGELFPE